MSVSQVFEVDPCVYIDPPTQQSNTVSSKDPSHPTSLSPTSGLSVKHDGRGDQVSPHAPPLSLCLSLSLPLSPPLSLPPSLSFCLSVSLSLRLSLCLPLFLSPSLSLPLPSSQAQLLLPLGPCLPNTSPSRSPPHSKGSHQWAGPKQPAAAAVAVAAVVAVERELRPTSCVQTAPVWRPVNRDCVLYTIILYLLPNPTHLSSTHLTITYHLNGSTSLIISFYIQFHSDISSIHLHTVYTCLYFTHMMLQI